MATSILITGASGLVGSRLTELFLQKGYQVAHLGREKKSGSVPSFVWDVKKGKLDPAALAGVDTIIHLAGAGVADKRWSEERKKEILESRTLSSALLYNTLKNEKHSVKTFISASAIGIYGFGLDDNIVATEESEYGTDFLSTVVVRWEKEVDNITSLGIRVSKIRIGIVLSEKGGALTEMARPVKLFVGSPLGSGRQILSWIHMDDLCGIFLKAVEDGAMVGAYNAVAPHPVSNREMTKAIAKILHKPLWAPAVPGFVLHIVIGEMAVIVINGRNVSADKIQRAGYQFRFTELETALKDLYS
ncbi:MAG: TIGR01777 family protein [Cyclobacteriaceae bacterium]|nr:TIGR01777 family protein [Cyclobacteriaceae bacterium]